MICGYISIVSRWTWTHLSLSTKRCVHQINSTIVVYQSLIITPTGIIPPENISLLTSRLIDCYHGRLNDGTRDRLPRCGPAGHRAKGFPWPAAALVRHRPVEQGHRAAGNAPRRVHEEAAAHRPQLRGEPAKVRRPHLPQALPRLPVPGGLWAQQTQR